MNEVSGGKPEATSSSAWDVLTSQQGSTMPLPMMHHHHQLMPQESNPPVTQVIISSPVKLAPPINSPVQSIAEIPQGQQPVPMVQVNPAVGYPEAELSLELQQQGWKKFWSKRENRPYFWNKLTGESLWVMPSLKPQVLYNII